MMFVRVRDSGDLFLLLKMVAKRFLFTHPIRVVWVPWHLPVYKILSRLGENHPWYRLGLHREAHLHQDS